MISNIKTIISLEGNIGVGKSSFLNILKEKLSDVAEFVDEPVDEWISMKNNEGKNLLEVFYGDKKRWSYTFQNIAYITRMKKIVDIIMNSNKKLIIMDRSLEGDLNTFTKMLLEDGDIDSLEWQAYKKWNTFFSDYIGKDIKTFHIYLRSNPTIAYSRITKRSRDEECSIPFEYIDKLSQYHDKWLINDILEEGVRNDVLVIDANKDFVEDQVNKEYIYNIVYGKFIRNHI